MLRELVGFWFSARTIVGIVAFYDQMNGWQSSNAASD